MNRAFLLVLAVMPGLLFTGCSSADVAGAKAAGQLPVIRIQPVVATDAVPNDADDPAIWVHPQDPRRSLIIGTDKGDENGGLYVFSLDGKLVQSVPGMLRPNNVDVEYGFRLGGRETDIAVSTERGKQRLRVFAIDRQTGRLTDVSGSTAVFQGEQGEKAAPMGIALYRRPSDGAVFAIVSRKTGDSGSYLGQYLLTDGGDGKVNCREVRRFGEFGGTGEIESVAVDDEAGFVYYSDEAFGIRKYLADPDAPEADRQLAVFGGEGYQGDREGLAIYTLNGGGYLISTDQIKNGSRYYLFPRDGGPAHRHEPAVAVIEAGADDTDGIEAVSKPLGDRFPEGILVVMNSKDRNFLIFDWRDIRKGLPREQAAAR
ncbi:MAG: 3-phytase [Armatimonadota bacterium]|nr:MAG: 3-phytase [Armatimonadota bacterium]